MQGEGKWSRIKRRNTRKRDRGGTRGRRESERKRREKQGWRKEGNK